MCDSPKVAAQAQLAYKRARPVAPTNQTNRDNFSRKKTLAKQPQWKRISDKTEPHRCQATVEMLPASSFAYGLRALRSPTNGGRRVYYTGARFEGSSRAEEPNGSI